MSRHKKHQEKPEEMRMHVFDKEAFWAATKAKLLVALMPGFTVSAWVIYRWFTTYSLRSARGMSMGEQLVELLVFLAMVFAVFQAVCFIVYGMVRKARSKNVFFVQSGIPVWRKTITNLGDEYEPDFITRDYRVKEIRSLEMRKDGGIVVTGRLEAVRLNNDGTPAQTVKEDQLVDDVKVRKKLVIPPYYQEMDVIWKNLTQVFQTSETKKPSVEEEPVPEENLGVMALIDRAAQQDPEAMYQIGRFYYTGVDQEALQKLGNHYYMGEETGQDYGRAFEWFADAADLGHYQAAFYAGVLLQDHGGTLFHGSPGEAEAYLSLAADGGYAEARLRLHDEKYVREG